MKGFDKASMVRRNKLISNLPKHDVGITPINSGYQKATNSIPVPFVSQQGQDLSQMASEQKQANVAQLVNSGAQLATQATGIVDIGKQLKNGAITRGTGAMLSAASTLPSAMQLYGAINTKNSFDGLGGNDLNLLASKNTEYRNGVAYENIGGVDNSSIMDAARVREFGENMNLTTSAIGTGAGVGATIGSFFPGAGNLIGAGIGALVGGLGSLFGWNNDEVKEQRRRINNWRIASNAANTQNEAVASSTGLRNEFYATHADEGLSPAFIGGGETKVATDGQGNVTGYKHFLETGATPRHADNILTQMKNTDGVLGNTMDPFTGRLVSDESKDVIYDPTLTKKQKNNLLTQFLWNQDVALNSQNMNTKIGFDRGRFMDLLSTVPGLYQMFQGAKRKAEIAGEPSVAINPYEQSPAAQMYIDNMFANYQSPYTLLREANRQSKQNLYGINTMPLSSGQRAAAFTQYMTNKMYGDAAIYNQVAQQNAERQFKASQAGLGYATTDQQLRYQGNESKIKQDGMQAGTRQQLTDTAEQTKQKGLNSLVGNLLQQDWVQRLISQYQYDPANYKPVELKELPTSSLYIDPMSAKGAPITYTPYKGSWSNKYKPIWMP